MIGFDEAIRIASATGPCLIAIDGLPVSGKTTLATRMSEALRADYVGLDEFVLPEPMWRGKVRPAFPFPFIDYAGFVDAVHALARGEAAQYLSYDWETGERSSQRTVGPNVPVIIEGVSSLNEQLAPLYDLRFWVESDAQTMLAASLERGVGDWAEEWRDLFLPSVELYLESDPARRADHRVAGRGAA